MHNDIRIDFIWQVPSYYSEHGIVAEIRNPRQKVDMITYARAPSSLPALEDNPNFAPDRLRYRVHPEFQTRVQLTHFHIREVIDRLRPLVMEDDEIQNGRMPNYDRAALIATYNEFGMLINAINAHLSPIRLATLHWLCREYKTNRSVPGYRQCIGIANKQLCTLVEEYIRMANEPADVRMEITSALLSGVLSGEQKQALADLIKRRAMGIYPHDYKPRTRSSDLDAVLEHIPLSLHKMVRALVSSRRQIHEAHRRDCYRRWRARGSDSYVMETEEEFVQGLLKSAGLL